MLLVSMNCGIIIYDIGGYMDRELVNIYNTYKVRIDDLWRLL